MHFHLPVYDMYVPIRHCSFPESACGRGFEPALLSTVLHIFSSSGVKNSGKRARPILYGHFLAFARASFAALTLMPPISTNSCGVICMTSSTKVYIYLHYLEMEHISAHIYSLPVVIWWLRVSLMSIEIQRPAI